MENKSAQEIVKEVFTPDYMGAAEYEFGRLPESMARMFDNADKLSLNLFELSIIKSEFPDLKLDPDKSVQDLLNDLPGEKKKNQVTIQKVAKIILETIIKYKKIKHQFDLFFIIPGFFL